MSYTLTVNPKELTVHGLTANNKTYDGTPTATLSDGSVNGLVDNDVVTVTATGTFANTNVGTDKTVNISDFTLAGAAAGNYVVDDTKSQKTATADITPLEATLSWSNTEFTYDGQTHVPTAAVSNLVSGDECTVTVTGEASEVGMHTATATALSNGNYTLPASATQSFTITAATMTGVSATGFTGTYDGTAHGISVTASEDATVTYGESADNCTATSSPTLTDAGEKTIYYKVSMAGYDDATGSATITIAPLEATLNWSNTEFTYDGQTHAPTATVSNLVSGDECTVTVTGEASEVGMHTATATALTNSNYSLPASATQSFTITAATMTGVSATGFTGTYDGAAHGISVTAPQGATVTYGESEGSYTVSSSPTLTNAGEKTIYYKVSMTGYDDVKGSATITITPLEATLGWSSISFTYDGQTHVPTATVSNLVSGDECTVTVTGAASEVGEHTATATALSNSNYTLPASATQSFTITAATMTGVSATGFTGTYDGAPHGISVTAPQGATVTYGESEGSYTATSSPTLTNVGENTIYYKVSMTGYDDVTGSATITIAPLEATLNWSNTEFTYDGQTHAPTATVSNLVSGDECTVTVTGAASEVGEHTATATALSNSNYSLPASATQSFTITAATMTGVSATGFTGTYDGTAHGISVTAPQGATVTYGESADNCTATSSPTLTNAGEKTIYYKVSMTGYDDVTGSATITIAKADATVTAPTGNTLNYTGQAQALVTGGSATGGTLEYSTDGQTYSTTVPTGTDVGEYTVYYRVMGDANHNDVAAASVKATIGKSQSTVETAPKAIEGLTYNGQPQALVTAGTATHGEMQYSTDGQTYSTTIPTATNAGTYDVWYQVKGSTGYNDVAAQKLTVTIAKANATVTAPTGNTLNYTGQAQTLVTGGSATGGTLEYSTDGQTYSTTVPTGTDVGEYTIYYRVTGDANHNDVAAASVKATISQSQSTVETAPQAIANLTYNEQPQALITAGTATHGEMQYSTDGQTYSTTIPTATNAGSYDVWYKVVGSTGYNDVEAQKLSVTIAKANLTVKFSSNAVTVKMGETFTPPTGTCSVSGLALTYTSSNEKVATVDASTGAVTLVSPGQTTITASSAGNDNYNVATASYVLTVVAADRISPITENQDYSFRNSTDYLNADGSDKSLKGVVINNIYYNLNVDAANGYDSEDHSIAIATPTTADALKNGVEKLGVSLGLKSGMGMAPYDPNSPYYEAWLAGLDWTDEDESEYSGMLFFVDPPEKDEIGELTIESKEDAGCQMAVQAGASETTLYQHNERKKDVRDLTVNDTHAWRDRLKVQAETHTKNLTEELLEELINRILAESGIPVGIGNFPRDHFVRTQAIRRGKKSASNVKVFTVSYKMKSATGIETIGNETMIVSPDGWYDLRGNRIPQPQKKGLYINNGRKVVVR